MATVLSQGNIADPTAAALAEKMLKAASPGQPVQDLTNPKWKIPPRDLHNRTSDGTDQESEEFEDLCDSSELLMGTISFDMGSSPIQDSMSLSGGDDLVKAKNGIGKTGACTIPLFEQINPNIQGLIVVPGQDMSFQSCQICADFSKHLMFTPYPYYQSQMLIPVSFPQEIQPGMLQHYASIPEATSGMQCYQRPYFSNPYQCSPFLSNQSQIPISICQPQEIQQQMPLYGSIPDGHTEMQSPYVHPSNFSNSSNQFSRESTNTHCQLCKSNREMPHIYSSHMLRNDDGKVVCPILRSFVCPICKATGDDAHTQKYCPWNPDPPFGTSTVNKNDNLRKSISEMPRYRSVRTSTGRYHSLKY